jgi:hypothetical protein
MASPRIKLLTCLITLSLIVGCSPSFVTPTPIPPLDPNAVGTFMVQTAEAASTQTMLALPPSTPTVTITPTPRNTFTPEPSLTPVQPYLFPTPTSYQKVQYYRVKHDDQLAMYNFKSRTLDNPGGMRNQTPEVVPLFLEPKLTTGTGRTDLSGAWEIYLDALNDNDEGRIRYVKGTKAGLFNTAGFPMLESLTMGGNIITLEAIQEGWGKVHTMAYGSPPSAAEVNYVTRPDLVHKFVVVGWKRSNKTTVIVKPPKGDVFWPFVAKRTLWIQMERLEAFPILPMQVTANKDLYMQQNPGPDVEETNLQLGKGESTTIVGYYPSGSDVWGRLPTGLWIPLLYRHQFLTTWTMATSSPP